MLAFCGEEVNIFKTTKFETIKSVSSRSLTDELFIEWIIYREFNLKNYLYVVVRISGKSCIIENNYLGYVRGLRLSIQLSSSNETVQLWS